MKAHLTSPCSRGLFSPVSINNRRFKISLKKKHNFYRMMFSRTIVLFIPFFSTRQLLSVYSYDFKSGIKCGVLFPRNKKKIKEKRSKAKLWHETMFSLYFFCFLIQAFNRFSCRYFTWKILLLFDLCPNMKKNNNKITSVQTCCWIFSFNPPLPLIFRWWYEGWKALIIFKEVITRVDLLQWAYWSLLILSSG